jgi:uncharacterized membrane protein YeaQ/YmgE (transglycosylase-associated protein family)
MVVRVDVAPVPVPAAGALLLGALGVFLAIGTGLLAILVVGAVGALVLLAVVQLIRR